MSTTTYKVDSQGRNVIDKGVGAILDYTFDWATWLGSDTIASASVVADADSGVTVGLVTYSPTKVTAWISGGTANKVAHLTCHVATAGTPSRTEERSIYLNLVKSR